MAIYHSFKEFAAARGIKAKAVKTKAMKCPKCGDAMRNVAGTNVFMCDHVDFIETMTPDKKPCQVFTKCKNVVYA